MGLFGKEEEDFDDSNAFDVDKGGIFKIILLILFMGAVIGGIGWYGYDLYQDKNDNNQSDNQTLLDTNTTPKSNLGEIVVNFEDFNTTVDENPQGLYYYTTQERVTGEKCYINNAKKDCRALTNSVCGREKCQKELTTVTDCFVNNKKIDCPE